MIISIALQVLFMLSLSTSSALPTTAEETEVRAKSESTIFPRQEAVMTEVKREGNNPEDVNVISIVKRDVVDDEAMQILKNTNETTVDAAAEIEQREKRRTVRKMSKARTKAHQHKSSSSSSSSS